jgi:hypothetical protein
MDAHELTPASSRARLRVARFVVAWLAAVLAAGLWQAYGAWLLGGGAGRVL